MNYRMYILILFVLYSFSAVSAQDKTFKYIGVKKCKTCHKSKKSGEQYKIWLDGPHANALKSLKSPEALDYAKKNGISDPSTDAKCLKCHSTFATVDKALIDPKGKLTMEEGVSCESCHGPGSEYKGMKIMKDQKLSMENGLILPAEKVCKSCHNPDNPFHKEFDFKKYAAKISHPVPEKK